MAGVKGRDQKQLIEETVYFGLLFQRGRNQKWWRREAWHQEKETTQSKQRVRSRSEVNFTPSAVNPPMGFHVPKFS